MFQKVEKFCFEKKKKKTPKNCKKGKKEKNDDAFDVKKVGLALG